MKVQISKVIYVTGVPDALMDKVRNDDCCWADGNYNICLEYEEALGFEEIRPLIQNHKGAGDVILCQ